MARCPYAPHRLTVGSDGHCRRCNGDVRLYAGLQALPAILFNDARRLWDEGNFEAARPLLQRAITVRPAFPTAYWLLGAVEANRGNTERARELLARAAQLGADVDLAWLDSKPEIAEAEHPSDAAAGEVEKPPEKLSMSRRILHTLAKTFDSKPEGGPEEAKPEGEGGTV